MLQVPETNRSISGSNAKFLMSLKQKISMEKDRGTWLVIIPVFVSWLRNLCFSRYHCFAGREASRAMALLSFDESELSNTRIDDLGAFGRGTSFSNL